MKAKKLLSVILCIAMFAVLFSACATDVATEPEKEEVAKSEEVVAEPEEEVVAPEEEDVTIAYLTPSTTVPFWNWVEEGVQKQCDANGWELITYDSKDDAATQLANAQNAITRQIDAIVISPCDSVSCTAVLDEAEAAGVPVVICDIGTETGEYLSFVSTPNLDGAKEVGAYVAEYMAANGITSGQVGQITVPLSRLNGQLRKEGFEAGMADSGAEFTTVLESTTFTLDEAVTQTKNIITANPDLIVVWAHHAQATLGAVSALEEQGLAGGKVIVAGFDGDPDIVKNLKNGNVLVCGAQQPKKMGAESVNAVKLFFDGGTPEKEISVPVLLLTADNVESMIPQIEENVCGLN